MKDVNRMATVEEQRDNWMETAKFHLRNEQYYREQYNAAEQRLAKLEAALHTIKDRSTFAITGEEERDVFNERVIIANIAMSALQADDA